MTSAQLNKIKLSYGIVGDSPQLALALETALKVARTDLSVLIQGESGVGKEVISRIIHDNSARKSKKYIAVNCGSIPEGTIDSELFGHEKGSFTGAVAERDGYFAAADGGTLFLDEVGEMPMATQARLLRVLETGEYMRVGSSQVRRTNVRIVAATNVSFSHAIERGKFRKDLYYRLAAIPIEIPPLRDRADDIPLLFKKFAMETAERFNMPQPITLNEESVAKLKAYAWPGNIRQLKNLAEQLSVMLQDNRIVTVEALQHLAPQVLDSHQVVAVGNGRKDSHDYEVEREIIFKMLLSLQAEVSDLKSKLDGSVKALDKKEAKWDDAEEIMNND